jgi:cytidine deaminase
MHCRNKTIKSRHKNINATYIINQIKNADEVKLFRKIYGKNFILISIYEHKDKRRKYLSSLIMTKKMKANLENLIDIDEKERTPYGQDMRGAFVEADYFVDINNLDDHIERFTKILLGYPYHTPTKEEINMAYAWIASTRSSDLSRQVGAAIANTEGDTISVGCNEVPKYKGGCFWENDVPDYRDFQIGFDANNIQKNQLIKETISVLAPTDDLETKYNFLKEKRAEILDIIEFCRAVHAEDAAICEAARRGICIQGTTLYCTTFPCHLCTKHIIAVGIKRVVYIYPYSKSRAKNLYDTIISINPNKHDDNEKVIFDHFTQVISFMAKIIINPYLKMR